MSTLISSATAPRSTSVPILKIMSILAVLGFFGGLGAALGYAGSDTMQGNVQRLFYVHLGALMSSALCYSSAFFGGVAYLRTRRIRWDMLAVSSIEVGLMSTVIALATGMVWARPTWNTWWTADPRLMAAAIMALTYAAYLMLRNGIENPHNRRLFASIYSILAISTVIYTFVITRLRSDSIHPIVIGNASNGENTFAMTGNMQITLGINLIVWCLLIIPVLIAWRIRLENAQQLESENHA